MRIEKISSILIVLFLLAGCAGVPSAAPASTPKPDYWPSTDWLSSTPEEQGMDSALLAGALQQIETQQLNLHSLLIVRNGILVTEAYFQPYDRNQPQYLASVTKSVISTLVGIAIQKGLIKDTSQTLVSFFPDQKIANLDDLKKSITLKDLLSLTAGLKCNDSPFSGEIGMEQSQNFVQFMLDSPMSEQPGTKFNYCGGAAHLLSAIIQKSTGMTAREFANQNLFAPLGIAEVPAGRWAQDPQGISLGPYGLYLTPRDMARLGYLYLRNGKWGEQQILPSNWVSAASTRHTTKDNGLGYGYLWTVDPDQGSFSALGLAGQEIYVIPSKDMVVVFSAALPSAKADMDFLPLKALVDQFIIPSVKSAQAIAANPSGQKQVDDLLQKAANPKAIVKAIPEGALERSGKVYKMDPNPSQWDTISFAMERGADTMTVTINGQLVDPSIGLDGVYRIQKQPAGGVTQAIRGTWEDENTLYIQLIYLGELSDSDSWITFSGTDITIKIRSVVNVQEFTIHGKRSSE